MPKKTPAPINHNPPNSLCARPTACFSLPRELLARIKKKAKDEKRSASYIVVQILEAGLDK